MFQHKQTSLYTINKNTHIYILIPVKAESLYIIIYHQIFFIVLVHKAEEFTNLDSHTNYELFVSIA
jgi:hypothetical protein